MCRKVKKTILIFVLVLLPLLPGCKQEGIIPPGDMESLLADFYKADATIQLLNEGSTPVALDSMRVYLPIVESYGYTKDEFRASLEHYLHRPDQMAKMFKHLRAKLEQEAVRPSSIVSEEEEEEPGENLRKGKGRKEEGPVGEELSTGEGTEPAIERIEEEKPVKQSKKNRKKLSKEEIKRLEEELK